MHACLLSAPHLYLQVRRGPYLVQDTLIQINRAKDMDALRKPLKVCRLLGQWGDVLQSMPCCAGPACPISFRMRAP